MPTAMGWSTAAAAAIGYFLGSIPFGLLLTRLAGMGDIRQIGSGNIGATNVLRTGKRGLALATLLLDGGKGALAVILARGLGDAAPVIAAVAAVLGHVFPVWLGFRGGKGVATALGVLLALAPPVGIAACLIWIAIACISGYSSLAAIVALACCTIVAFVWREPGEAEATLAIALIVGMRHHENIRRLLRGEESRIRIARAKG